MKYSQTDKRNILWYYLYVDSKQNDASELIYKAETPADLENEVMVVWEGLGWEGRDG